MADEKLNTGPEAQKTEEAPAPARWVIRPHGEAVVARTPAGAGRACRARRCGTSAEQIDALMAEKRAGGQGRGGKGRGIP